MKSVYAKFSLLLLFASTVVLLSAANDGKTVSAGKLQKNIINLEEKYKEEQRLMDEALRLFNEELKDLTIAAFKQRMEDAKLNKNQIDFLQKLIYAPDIKVRDIRDKILYLAERGGEKYGRTLFWAYQKNDRPMINQLRALGYDINEALLPAILNDPDTIFVLLRDGARLSEKDIREAIQASRLKLFDSSVIDPKYKIAWNKWNERTKRRRILLPQLIKTVKNINWRDETGSTLLFYAPDKEIAALLINAGIDVNAQDILGNTTLLEHVQSEYEEDAPKLELIAYLIQKGADPNIKNKLGESALSIAQKEGLTEIVSILEGGKSLGVNKKK